MGAPRLLILAAVSVVLASCTPSVRAPEASISKVKGGTGAYEEHSSGVTNLGNQRNFESDMAVETDVSQGCLEAWRKVTGDNHDEKGAMKKLDAMGRMYPNVTTISFMKGQVLDHVGKKEEAIKYYKQAITDKEFSTIHVFKLAEALRVTHKDEEAVEQYKRLLASAPDFPDGKIGLAKSLLALDKHSPAAREQLVSLVKSENEDKHSKELHDEAQTLLTKMNGSTTK